MGEFRFKKFSVANEKGALKVNTDGVLLGVCCSVAGTSDGEVSVLDIGTGTGVVALLMCQRLEGKGVKNFDVTGVEIDPLSYEEASGNFLSSPWKGHLRALNCSFERVDGLFTHILCNPPYFLSALPNPDSRKATARHSVLPEVDGKGTQASTLNWKSALYYSRSHLVEGGIFSVILPYGEVESLEREARMAGLPPFRKVLVRTVVRKPWSRAIVEMTLSPLPIPEKDIEVSELTIQGGGAYTQEYNDLMRDFYLWAK